MNRSALLPAAFLFDRIVGDPEWFPHPVRIVGYAISIGEAALRHPNQSRTVELISGAVLTVAIVGSSYWATEAVIRCAHRSSALWGDAAELLLAWTCLAARNLEQEATTVTNALQAGNLPLARRRLARIVGRDTENLDSHGASRAVIETVAESASDGVVAPLFYMALGGVPLAMAYKAINTLDSMIGHADSEYFYFGKAAARLDDAANYLPSRISALAIILGGMLCNQADPRAGWRTWQRDGSKHRSPNAGQPESTMAGTLHVALGGDNTYSGELVSAERMGAEFSPPTPNDAMRAIRLVSAASLISLGFCVLLTSLARMKRRS